MVKQKIQKEIEKQARINEESKTKLRHQKGQKCKRQDYIRKSGIKNTTEMIRTRLEMWDIRRNWGKR